MSSFAGLFGDRSALISEYVDILTGRGIEWGLLGPREADRIWERHILNSIAPAELVPAGATLVDVGSGAGLPGLPLAILRPDLGVTLLEPLLRRANFLTLAVEELGLTDQVQVVRSRAGDYRGQFDVITARAVAPLERLLGWCDPLRNRDGSILALKGRTAADEVAAARAVLASRRLHAEVLTLRPHPDAEPATVVRVRPQ